MISAQFAITKTRRDLVLAAVVRWVMLIAVGMAIFAQPLMEETRFSAIGVLMAIGAIWLLLSFRSFRGSRIAADSSSLIAAGQYDLAEEHIAESLRSFSIFRAAKLASLHHLAVLRHAQNRWQESALLCRALLGQFRRSSAAGNDLDRSSRLILAESLLELGDLNGAYENIVRLYDQRLSLREALNLMAVQLDYLSRIGAWETMLASIMTKVQMAELLPTLQASRAQALLALAARKIGRLDWADWLRRRVELLVDVQKLCTDRPMLWDVWRA